MAMTLRLSDDVNDSLRAQADAEGRSMQAVAQDAVREYIDRHKIQTDIAAGTRWVLSEYREALRRLGEL
jgi:predicted transcriptional regulator